MYENLASFAQTWGLLFFIFAFILVLIYAFLPANRKEFDRARQIPLDENDEHHG